MPDNSDPQRDAIHEAIQANAQHLHAEIGGALLTGWVLIAEWVDSGERGDRWLSHARAASTPQWTARGMAHEFLFGDWPDGDEPDAE